MLFLQTIKKGVKPIRKNTRNTPAKNNAKDKIRNKIIAPTVSILRFVIKLLH